MNDSANDPGVSTDLAAAASAASGPGEPARELPQDPRDLELVQRLRGGDEAAFTDLIERHHGAMLRLALAFVPSRAVAEEVVQETWLSVLDGLSKFEGRSTLKTWIFRILTNRAKTRGIREHRSVPLSSFSESDATSESAVDPARFHANGHWAAPPRRWEESTPEKLLMTQQAIEQLESAIATLPANQQAVVTLRDIEGLDAHEVCNVLGISETHQRVLLHRGRSRLRAALEAYMDPR
jgi:RNA polymerase sigma-70 factor, ECF subfamily